MILTVTFLIVAQLQFTQPTHVADLHPQTGPTIELKQQEVTGVPLGESRPTIVKTWEINQ